MTKLILVGLGGFIGSIMRYGIGEWLHDSSQRWSFPLGTLVVNIVGCFIIGMLAQLAEGRGVVSAEVRAFLVIGILGGFTTYSSFGNESVNLFRDGDWFRAWLNVLAHLVLGLGAVWAGRIATQKIWG